MADAIRATSPLCRIRYPKIFTPRTEEKTDPKTQEKITITKYGAQLVFDQSVAQELEAMKAQVFELGKKEFGDNFWALVQQRTIRWPFREGSEIDPKTGQPRFGNDVLAFMNVSSYQPVDVVSRYCDPADPNRRPVKVTDPAQLWSGEYCKAALSFKAYKRSDSWGIGVYINGLQLWHEGEKFNDGFDAQSAFSAEGEMPSAEMPPQQPPAPPAPPTPGNSNLL